MNVRHALFGLVCCLPLLSQLCAPLPTIAASPAATLQIFVSILPEEFLVTEIGGTRVQVETLVQPGHNMHTYAPTPLQMARLAKAQFYFRIGVPFEAPLIAKLQRSVPDLKIVDLQEGIDLMQLEESDEEHHEHGGEMDPHTWLDPNLALKQAQHIHATLVALDPAGREEYDRNLARLSDDLRELDQTLRTILQPFAGQTIYVFHPAYGYFCRAYNLKQKAINVLGKETGAKHLARLIEEAKRDGVRVIFVQPQFSEKTAETIARSIGGSVVSLDNLSRDYLANMKVMALQIAAAQTSRPHEQ